MLENLGRVLIWTGAGLLALGLVLVLLGRIPGLGRLPGDILIQRERFTVYIPLGTMLLLSFLLTLVLNILTRSKK